MGRCGTLVQRYLYVLANFDKCVGVWSDTLRTVHFEWMNGLEVTRFAVSWYPDITRWRSNALILDAVMNFIICVPFSRYDFML